jgi:hypothetical protein
MDIIIIIIINIIAMKSTRSGVYRAQVDKKCMKNVGEKIVRDHLGDLRRW